MRIVLLAVVAACAGRAPPLTADAPSELPPDATRHYTIWLGGARVGTATETERWTPQGVRVTRRELLRFLRGDAEMQLATEITVDASPALAPRHVWWSETATDVRAAEATRTADGWQLSTGEHLSPDAVPAELVPLLVRRDGAFSGTIFLPARGFITGAGRIDPVAPGRLIGRVALASGPTVEATIDLARDGMPARIVDGDGVIAIRTSAAQAAEPFEPVDVIAATAIPITGERRSTRLVLDGNLAVPPVPGQRTRPAATGIEIELSAALPGDLPTRARTRDRSADIRDVLEQVRARITPDLHAPPGSARDATSATAGDCTTFALAYAALASSRGIPTRVVTGLRVDHTRLIRHRWAVSWTGERWIAIDAAFGRAPAGGNLIGLAVHDADAAGLVAGEAALTQVRSAAWL